MGHPLPEVLLGRSKETRGVTLVYPPISLGWNTMQSDIYVVLA
jgi:hypothetical protein